MAGVGVSRIKPQNLITLQEAMHRFLEQIRRTQSHATYASYRQAISAFSQFLEDTSAHATIEAVASITTVQNFLTYLQQNYSPETEHAYLRAVAAFIQSTTSQSAIDSQLLDQITALSHTTRRKKTRLEPQIPYDAITQIRAHLASYPIPELDPDATIQRERLRVLRDKALIFTIMDTGLKPSEISDLHISDINHDNPSIQSHGMSLPISHDTHRAIRNYLAERMALDTQEHIVPYNSLPIFARHDKRASDHVLSISRWTVGNIITFWSKLAAESNSTEGNAVTPSLLRHHFVASTLEATHDLQLTQQRARHKDRGTTRHYLRKTNSTTTD